MMKLKIPVLNNYVLHFQTWANNLQGMIKESLELLITWSWKALLESMNIIKASEKSHNEYKLKKTRVVKGCTRIFLIV